MFFECERACACIRSVVSVVSALYTDAPMIKCNTIIVALGGSWPPPPCHGDRTLNACTYGRDTLPPRRCRRTPTAVTRRRRLRFTSVRVRANTRAWYSLATTADRFYNVIIFTFLLTQCIIYWPPYKLYTSPITSPAKRDDWAVMLLSSNKSGL